METPESLNRFVEACVPLAPSRDHDGVAALLRKLIADPETFASTVPAFDECPPSDRGWVMGGEHVCHQSDELTVMVLDTLPGVLQPPHDHSMKAIIGVFEGQEDQRFYAKVDGGATPSSTRSLGAGEVVVLGEQAVHAISSPPGRHARAVHVYFGDIYEVERSLYHPETLEQVPYSGDGYDEFCRPDPASESTAS